jgi:1-acyl-sn-glycerol-3-phosphate acyltransferase
MSDWFYRLGRNLVDQSIRLYYRRIEVQGAQHIPAVGPTVLVANHPNSVTDAFLLASQLTHRKVNFIAKDSVSRSLLYGWLVRRFGVVGVARGMDYEHQRALARQRNESAIASVVPRLLAGELVAIFGEGISNDARRLHMIRKGAMRLGYAAERAANFKLGATWVPVGISYTAKQQFRSDILIRVGRPFYLADVASDPAACEPEVLQRGTRRLQHDLESLVVNIEREELAPLIDRLASLLVRPTASLAAQVEIHQRVARAVEYFNTAEPHRLTALEKRLGRYQTRLVVAGLADEVVRQRHPTLAVWSALLCTVQSSALMALNLYGWANSLVPRWGAQVLRPLGRRPPDAFERTQGSSEFIVAREALWATFGGLLGAAVAFPLQIWLVYHWVAGHAGGSVGAAVATLYALSLIPSWHLFVGRRDVFRRDYHRLRDALRFLSRSREATKLQIQRRRLQRQLRTALAAYDAMAPRFG